jgi:putative endonuclease
MYILLCADKSYYTGSTWDLEKRFWEHEHGLGANYTRKRSPVKLVYCEYHDRVEDAYRREKQVQGWSHRKKQALIEGNFEKLIEFSKNYTQFGNRISEMLASTGSADEDPLPEPVERRSEASMNSRSSASRGQANEVSLPEPVEGSSE